MLFRSWNFFFALACFGFFFTTLNTPAHAESTAKTAPRTGENRAAQRIIRPFQRNAQPDPQALAQPTDGRVVLLDFYGDFCSPCRAMDPVIERLRSRGYSIRKINTTQEPALAAEFRVSAIPCFVVLADGKEHARCVGSTPESRLAEMMHAASKTLAPISQFASDTQAPQRQQRPTRSAWRGMETPFSVEEIAANRWNPEFGRVSSGVEIIPASHAVAADSRPAETEPAYTPSNTSFPLRPITGSAAGSEIKPVSYSASQNSGAMTKNPAHDHLLASTVRIHLTGGWRGSGTIIDCRNGHALILTCGHLFREYRHGDKIHVDLFGENRQQGVEATYLAHEYDTRVGRDLAVIRIPVTEAVRVSALAPADFPLRKGMGVTTAGCTEGNLPSIQTAVVTGMNRVMPIPILKVSAQSIEGRSGGGYFASQTGELIGVCIAADPENNEGLSIPAETIHDFLNRCNLARFACAPLNESVQLAGKTDPRNLMPLEMPESEPVIQLTTLPRPAETPHIASETTSASAPAAVAATVATRSAGRSLTGAPMPAWPPRW